MNKLLTAGVVLALLLGVVGVFFPQVTTVIRETVVGGGVSQNQDFPWFFNAGAFISGGLDPDKSVPVLTGSAAASSTITASSSMICTNNVIESAFTTATGTLTLPGAADYRADGRCLVNVGDMKTFFIINANDTVGTTTFAGRASTSISFLASGNNTGTASTTLLSSSTARVDAFRFASSSNGAANEWIQYTIFNNIR